MSRGLLILSLCAALMLAIAGCGGDDDSSTSTEATTAQGAASNADLEVKPEVTVPDGPPPKRLETREIVKGDGAEAKPGDTALVQYVGVGYKTGEQFDASWDNGSPFPFTIGQGEVISGWDEGVAGMKVGGRRELIIPPDMAYGAAGSPPLIAPNETLVFIVDLISVEKG